MSISQQLYEFIQTVPFYLLMSDNTEILMENKTSELKH